MSNIQNIDQENKILSLNYIFARTSYFAHRMFTTDDKIYEIIQITFLKALFIQRGKDFVLVVGN